MAKIKHHVAFSFFAALFVVGCQPTSNSSSSSTQPSNTTMAHHEVWTSIPFDANRPRSNARPGIPLSAYFIDRNSTRSLPASPSWTLTLPAACDQQATCNFGGYQCSGLGTGALQCDYTDRNGDRRRAAFLSDGRLSISNATFSFDEPHFIRTGVWHQGTSRQIANATSMWSRMVALYSGATTAQAQQRAADQRAANQRAIRNATAILSGVATGLSGQPPSTPAPRSSNRGQGNTCPSSEWQRTNRAAICAGAYDFPAWCNVNVCWVNDGSTGSLE